MFKSEGKCSFLLSIDDFSSDLQETESLCAFVYPFCWKFTPKASSNGIDLP